MYMLAIGLQGAGPEPHAGDLRAGHVRLPARSSAPPACGGSVRGDYTPTNDVREIYWDPNAISTYNGKKGAYLGTEHGQRYRHGADPDGDPGNPP